MEKILITIDGPAGAGKTTVSRILADRLSYTYIDTGALYRGVAFQAKSAGISPDDDTELENLCRTLSMKFIRNEKGNRLFANGSDISDHIRTPDISMLSSLFSAKPGVRKYLLNVQREMGQEKGVIFEGRDMGTVVFPDADMKFFLEASLKTRADRRYKESGHETDHSPRDVENDIRRRDENDRTRDIAPLKPAEDAIFLDSTDISAQEVVAQMLSHIKNIF
ncbi:MAG: cytidylate kinase [Desulfobacteraceae bacterium 4572_88]|nr:MAG: cytidylate kinase [Desulfobacteraceae bacterium 4572_88]